MKWFLVTVTLVMALSTHSQPLAEKLKQAIEKIEREEHSKGGEKVSSLHIDILSYSIIPLRDWVKRLIDAEHSFQGGVDSMFNYAYILPMRTDMDSVQRKQLEESLKAFENALTVDASDTTYFDNVAYLKKKYEQTPPSVKVYEVKYKLDLQSNWGGSNRDSLRRVLNLKDLSNVDVH